MSALPSKEMLDSSQPVARVSNHSQRLLYMKVLLLSAEK
jgi:hypothetical protein